MPTWNVTRSWSVRPQAIMQGAARAALLGLILTQALAFAQTGNDEEAPTRRNRTSSRVQSPESTPRPTETPLEVVATPVATPTPAPTATPAPASRPAEVAPPAAPAAPAPAAGEASWSDVLGSIGGAVPLVIVLVLIGAVVLVFSLLRRGNDTWSEPAEPEPPSSRFEQLGAEIQGLRLRLQGGESRGYYRKVEVLARIFLERTGAVPGARQMAEDELQTALANHGAAYGQAVQSILDRTRRAARDEREKQDFTADDLLKDLQTLIRQADANTPRNG